MASFDWNVRGELVHTMEADSLAIIVVGPAEAAAAIPSTFDSWGLV